MSKQQPTEEKVCETCSTVPISYLDLDLGEHPSQPESVIRDSSSSTSPASSNCRSGLSMLLVPRFDADSARLRCPSPPAVPG
jgi:hypothetical protein